MVQPADDAEDSANELRYLGRILALWERVLAPDVLSLNRARRDLCERCSAMSIPIAIGYLINAVNASRADNWL